MHFSHTDQAGSPRAIFRLTFSCLLHLLFPYLTFGRCGGVAWPDPAKRKAVKRPTSSERHQLALQAVKNPVWVSDCKPQIAFLHSNPTALTLTFLTSKAMLRVWTGFESDVESSHLFPPLVCLTHASWPHFTSSSLAHIGSLIQPAECVRSVSYPEVQYHARSASGRFSPMAATYFSANAEGMKGLFHWLAFSLFLCGHFFLFNLLHLF